MAIENLLVDSLLVIGSKLKNSGVGVSTASDASSSAIHDDGVSFL